MELLKKRIEEEGRVVGDEILKVDSFLNHQMDIELFQAMGEAFYERFKTHKITKILTVEASGIGIAAIAALYFKVPVVFAKKTKSRNLDAETYTAEVYSFTKQAYYDIQVSKRYLSEDDHILILDDFLANGKAALGLMAIVEQAGATVEGIGIVIEKGFQEGGKLLRERSVHLESLAIIDGFENGKVIFRK
ncbi:xanthine phosphoribosyltransferase [Fusibacter paucivorans]|uniref:Xanthine phosphoribosyltransferase n=1 Tax=Fusibacter paucivorans TaxID=76009 RepID=A0ABS5PVP8_9FIRM|nr:xanthine phosphoribosyltransferase [Fusibacter paucivorans]MBS7528257.1 xanthine phosphoribosyltransferase [Fusibacter paucivorans]